MLNISVINNNTLTVGLHVASWKNILVSYNKISRKSKQRPLSLLNKYILIHSWK